MYCTESTKWVMKGYFHAKKLSYLFSQEIRALTLISFSTEILNLARVLPGLDPEGLITGGH